MSTPQRNQDGRIPVLMRVSRKLLLAVFPLEPAGLDPAFLYTVDEGGVVGHITASTFKHSIPADATRYREFASTLERRGWKLDVRQRMTADMDQVRATRCLRNG